LQTISKAKENMAFVLPCADTAIDTRLRICIAPSPSLSAGNTAVTAPTSGGLVGIENPITHEVEECVLTMASCWEYDNKGFLRGKVAMLENDIYTKATKLLDTAPWNKLHSLIDELEDIGCLCVAGCGHKFSGVPLLYTVLLSKQMRASGSYFVELIFDIETARHVIFQSHKINHKSAPATGQPRTCPHTEHTIGECDIFFEKCVYRNENFFKRVSYNVQETQLRAMIIGITGLT